MSNRMIASRLTKKDILTIPNILSFVRILLIPVIVIFYCVYHWHLAAVGMIALSGLTDVLDGKIARKFNMISDFGKFIDPVADKLTQAAMILCLLTEYSEMGFLFILMALKESLLFIAGYISLSLTDTVTSAKWYGKVSTLVMYTIMIVLFTFPGLPMPIAKLCIAAGAFVLIGSMLLYGRFYYKILKENAGKHTLSKAVARIWKGILLFDWLIILALFFYYSKSFSFAALTSFSPKRTFFAAVAVLLLFALKSVSFTIYIGILYAVSGLLFTTEIAFIINIIGSVLSLSIPYALGRKIDDSSFEELKAKHLPLARLFDRRQHSPFVFTFLTWLIGGVAMDTTGIFIGYNKFGYCRSVFAGILGLLPRMIIYTILGANLYRYQNPAFLIPAALAVISLILSFCILYNRKKDSDLTKKHT